MRAANIGLETLCCRVASVGNNVDDVGAGWRVCRSGGRPGGQRGRYLNALLNVRVANVVGMGRGRWTVFGVDAVWTVVTAGLGRCAGGLACVGRHGCC